MPLTKEPYSKALEEKKLRPVPDVLRLSLPSWIFGTALLLFILGVFVFSPPTLPEYKQRILALTSALVGGIFAFFMTGDIGLRFIPTSSNVGKITTKASGGLAVFVLVLWWWTSPMTPIRITKAVVQATSPSVSIAGGVSDNKGVVGNVTGNVYISGNERHSRKLTRVEAETFLQANRGNIEVCLSRLPKKYFYMDFVFLRGDDGSVNVDIIPGWEKKFDDAVFMHPRLHQEEVESYDRRQVVDEARSEHKLSVTAPDVNGCILSSLRNELDRYSLENSDGFVHRYITRTGFESGP